VFPKISLREINELERIFLTLIDYDVNINGSEYAKYYFILRSLAENVNMEFPLKPITYEEIQRIKKNLHRIEAKTNKTLL